MSATDPRPIVAIVGRPNVGKSTLFNRLVGHRVAIVHDEPGVTRDRNYADATCLGRSYTLVDTGGFDPESDDRMQHGIQQQIEIALDEADILLCVLDAKAPPTAMDAGTLDRLRRTNRPVLYLANKTDSDRIEAEGTDLYRLGMPTLHFVSALHGRGLVELEDVLGELLDAAKSELRAVSAGAQDGLPPAPDESRADTHGKLDGEEAASTQATPGEAVPRVAVVGRPNAGKSSLINRLLGADRLLVDEAPGTTRDPIDTLIERRGRSFVFVDTAGLRRKSRVKKGGDTVEATSVLRGIRAIDRAQIAVVLCDAARGVDEQDAKILGLALERGRAAVVALNKTDLLDRTGLRRATDGARDTLSFAAWVPLAKLSARTGRGTGQLLDVVARVAHQYGQRVPTGALNRFFEEVLSSHTPPVRGGRAPRFYFITQAQTAPPLFVVETSHPDQIHFSYQRYVINAIRKQFGFEGVPLRVRYRRAGRRRHR